MSGKSRAHWQRRGIPAAVIGQMAAFEDDWGGLLLPPGPWYEGGPKMFRSDVPEPSPRGDWWFEAGDPRFSVPFGFRIGPRGEFAIGNGGGDEVVLHESVAGWVESLALAHEAAHLAAQITRVRGAAADHVDLAGLEPFPEVAGVSDTWWHGGERVVAVYRGMARFLGKPALQAATVYDGITDARHQLA